jgi:cytoskeletal protein CcmA (bactofilin family)
MSNLKDLFISQSFFGIINLENSTQPITSQSGDIQLQDGIGTNLGIFINASTKDVTISNKLNVDDTVDIDGDLDVVGNIYLSGSWIHTGSIDVKGDVTVDGNVSANIATFDTVNTRLLHVTEESASVIFSSGSNILGDENTDTQTLNGSVYIPFKEFLKGNVLDTDTRINQKQNSGSFNAYTQSTDSRLNNIESFTSSQENINSGYNSFTESVDNKFTTLQSYTASVDSSLSSLNAFTSSQLVINSGYNSFTQSANTRITALENFSTSLDNTFVSEAEFDVYTSSIEVEQQVQDIRLTSLETFTGSLSFDFVDTSKFNTYTASVDSSLSSINSFTASADVSITALNVYTASQDVHNSAINNFTASQQSHNSAVNTFTESVQSEVDALVAATSSYARLDIDNSFSGNQTIDGYVNGNVEAITITSQTASIDCSTGNFFTVTLPQGVDTHFTADNINAGQTVSLKVLTNTNTTASIDVNSIRMLAGAGYTPTQANSIDILTFSSFDTSFLYGVTGKFFS